MKVFFFIVSLLSLSWGHLVQHDVGSDAVYVSIFFDKEHKAAWSRYELYAPNASLPYQKGRSDASGVVTFLPDRTGTWRLDVYPGSDHGEHFQKLMITVDENMVVKETTKPLYSKYGALITGLSLVFGIFGMLYGVRQSKNRPQNAST